MKDPKHLIYCTAKDYLVSQETFTLHHDVSRDILITDPQPPLDSLYKYYESDAYISHTDSKKGIVSFLYQIVKKNALQSKVSLLEKLNKGIGTLLDIGAGTGDFLKQATNKGWTIEGVEPNASARKLASQKGVSLAESIEDFNGQQFDVVTLWHVLEHLPNLEETIKRIEDLINPGGVLIIAVPNFKSYDAKHYQSFWAAFDVPRHLWHFSKKSMTLLFSKKMKLEKIIPMLFDSFYVSLLSEKNKTGSQNLIKAFWVGLRSNIAAWSTKEYSSLIYCYKKQK